MNVYEAGKVLVAIRDEMIDVDYEGYKEYDAWLKEGKEYLRKIFLYELDEEFGK